MSFASLGLRAELLLALEGVGYTTPTPVQAQAIPAILQGNDILAGAQTGTGKTAGFTLPLLQRLMAERPHVNTNRTRGPRSTSGRPIRALILTPTRELAAQVEQSIRTYGKHLPLTTAVVFGGVNMGAQVKALQRGVDILVATPGRLLDHIGQGTADLSQVETFVLDEADRMLDMGFIRDIRRIVPLLPTKRQTLLFSATFSDEIRKLAEGLLHEPVSVDVAPRNAESGLVAQSLYSVSQERKRDLLVHILVERKVNQALVFTRTKHGADRLMKHLNQYGVSGAVIHGNRSQPQRTKALADFKSGAARILVATDIAARGLDIQQLPHVINFEIPNIPEDYVHRIGRTGRAGHVGEAISLVSPDEAKYLTAIEKLIKKRIDRCEAVGFIAPPITEQAPAPRQFSGASQGGRSPQRGSYGGDSGRGFSRDSGRDSGRERSARPFQPGRPRPKAASAA